MHLIKLTAENAVEYLEARGHLAPGESASARELCGGVSNMAIHVARSGGDDLVLKQARGQLKVAEPWYCSVDRIWREVDVLGVCSALIRDSRMDVPLKVDVPQLFFVDRGNFLYAMSAAPRDHVVWKHELLSGTARKEVSRSCGILLGTLHSKSWHDASLAKQLDDRQFFEDLRLDPYYRQICRVHEELAPHIERLIDSVWSERHCLVHGDFSPKNLLIHGDRLMLIDFEVGHYGDPAFDLGFFISHLALKAYYQAPGDGPYFDLVDSFWSGYCEAMAAVVSAVDLDAVVQRGILNFAGCALARLDGKSKIDYLDDLTRRDAMRKLCWTVFTSQPQFKKWSEVRVLAQQLLTSAGCNRCTDEAKPVIQ